MEITLSINNGKEFESFKIRETFIPELEKLAPGQRQLFYITSRKSEAIINEDHFFNVLRRAVIEVLNIEKAEKPYTNSMKGIEKAEEV